MDWAHGYVGVIVLVCVREKRHHSRKNEQKHIFWYIPISPTHANKHLHTKTLLLFMFCE